MSYQEVAAFANDVIQVHPSLRELFFVTMEEADNGVLYDYYQKASKEPPPKGTQQGRK